MTPQAVTAEELVEYLTDIVDQHGDIPAIISSGTSGAVESVGPPIALPVIPAGEIDGFQAYEYAPPEATTQTKAALIN